MLTKDNIVVDFEALRAEHEAALASIERTAEAERKREEWFKSRLGKFTSSDLGRLMADTDYLNLTDSKVEEIRNKYKPRGNDKYSTSDLSKEYGFEESLIRKIIKPDFQFSEHLSTGALTYIEEKALEILTEGQSVKRFSNDSMDRGNEKELEAVLMFEQKYDVKCYATGENQEFVELCSYFGGTPDGLIDADDMIEVKCPDCKTHAFRVKKIKNQADFKEHEKDYYWQIQGNFLATGRKKCYFIDYDDRFTKKELQLHVVEIHRNEEDIQKIKTRLKMAENQKQIFLNNW
ncbi:hypothetical protein C1637_09740 [Chryseobacterium lactis]|uniref:YqaJ viral recombinase domain-containing protein n=1 Tax=Chryseobacterium lactis TaxID=1241981 RepID=A0A3G6RHB9_CHRLC|nr:YqaJ viral recombinase family protein [Chryseobacterium lactis]AZA82208.1 hypothetical protein EG342_09960 [Chryseobacterium lactis]AZB02589.1 hypothetical protein EG341_00815 [Chryseobacterium lactis]PNW14116.1 hypothetical protein C1637_09740 [Chryseobacterium lactis]